MIRVVVDMNLGQSWIPALRAAGIDAVHWSSVGAVNAPDSVIFAWAAGDGRVVITCDLDFSQILAASGATKPSVLLLRARDVSVPAMGQAVVRAIVSNEAALEQGSLIMLDATRSRLRVLPLRRQ